MLHKPMTEAIVKTPKIPDTAVERFMASMWLPFEAFHILKIVPFCSSHDMLFYMVAIASFHSLVSRDHFVQTLLMKDVMVRFSNLNWTIHPNYLIVKY